MTWPAPDGPKTAVQDRRPPIIKPALTPEEIDSLRGDDFRKMIELGLPSLAEIDKGTLLLKKRWPVHMYFFRKDLRWFVKTMNTEFGAKWTVPWDK